MRGGTGEVAEHRASKRDHVVNPCPVEWSGWSGDRAPLNPDGGPVGGPRRWCRRLVAAETSVDATVEGRAMLIIIVSDNTAGTMLLDLPGGPAPINAMVQTRLGLRDALLHAESTARRLGVMSAALPGMRRDLMTCMVMLARGEVVSRVALVAIIAILRQQHLDRFCRYRRLIPMPRRTNRRRSGSVARPVRLPGTRSVPEWATCQMAK